MTTGGRKCVWCGARANSKEHVYPKWLRKFEGPASYIAAHGSYQDSSPWLVARRDVDGNLVEYPVTRGKKTPNLHEVQVKAVCEDCNTGWMSRLETDIQPLMRRLTSGPHQRLSVEEMRRSAIWAHKSFLMYDLQYDELDRCYRREDYQGFHGGRVPAGNVRLYLAACDSPKANFGMWSDSRILIPEGVDSAAYVATHRTNCGSSYFAVNGLVIIEHWFAPDYPSQSGAGMSIKKKSQRTMRKLGVEIWPHPQPERRWPRRVLDPEQTEAAQLSLFDALRLTVHARRVPPPN